MRLHSNKNQQITGNSLSKAEPVDIHKPEHRTLEWVTFIFSVAVLAGGIFKLLIFKRPDAAGAFAPEWIPIAAAIFAGAGVVPVNDKPKWIKMQGGLSWTGLLLMVWTANGIPFDLLRIAGLIPLAVDWPGTVARVLALVVVILLARIVMSRPVSLSSGSGPGWFGYAAFVLALPYPIMRIYWALGGTVGVLTPGGAGTGIAPLILAIPWILAAMISLYLVSKPRWLSRKLLLTAAWTATAIVAMIGPAAFWSMVQVLLNHSDPGNVPLATWVFCLFYTSWFLWAIAACAATRSFQLRSAPGSGL